jgi:hypothetical protein
VNAATMLSLALVLPLFPSGRLAAQGVTTGAISGTVTDAAGKPVENAQVQITNRNTGFRSGSITRANGYYYVQGLEVGGPYTVNVRRIGYEPVERNGVTVSLSSTTRVDLQLAQSAVTLSAVTVSGQAQASTFSPTHQGVSTEVTDSLIRRIPTINRNLTDLVKLTPQVSQPSSGGPSAGGQYNRYNNFTIDGANQNDRFNLASSGGLPGSAGGGRIISQEAVKSFRVLLSPTDVRQANFTGMLVNAVTKSGTNEFHGGAIYDFRTQNLSGVTFRQTSLDVKQYGFQLGGPIIKDKLQFFVAPEWQQRTTPAGGPFVGQVAGSTGSALNIDKDSIAYVQSIIQSKMGFDPGTSGRVDIANPLTNLFGRLDYQLNDVHRLVLRQLINRTENLSFSRNLNTFNPSVTVQNQGFRLGSNSFNGVNTNNSTVAQLYSNFQRGISNEFIAGFNQIRDQRIVPGTITPEMSVAVVPLGASNPTNPTAAITFGTEQFSVGNDLKQNMVELQDNVSIPFGAHTFTVGGRYEHLHVYDNFAQAAGGVWVFPTIAALNNLQPSGYRVAYANSGNVNDIPAAFNTDMKSLYAQDQWAMTPNLTITAGLRADVPTFLDKPSENTQLASAFAAKGVEIHTSWTPKTQILWSPRIGFNWDINGNQTNQLRGNVGIFTGPPPFVLVANAYQNTGLGLVTLSCTGAANVPVFTVNESQLPKSCLNQAPPAPGSAGTAGINLTDPNFKYPQYFITSFGVDRALPYGLVGTFEALYRHAVNGVFIRDINLVGPRTVNGQVYTDRNGRVLYADTIFANGSIANPNGSLANANQRAVTLYNGVNFNEDAIEVTNQSKDYNYSLTGQLRRTFAAGLDLTFAYTYNRSYEIQSLTSDRAISNWRFGREYSGLESDQTLTTSQFERRHRVLAYGTWTLPWWKKLGGTDVTLYYEGMSGTPIDYIAGGNGDLNGDGTNNDPIYIPKDATDPNEFKIGTQNGAGVFTQNAADAKLFNDFISSQKCLNDQRGQIMKRSSCTTPWQNRLDLSLRQSLPQIRGQAMTVELDVVNFANALGLVLNHVDGRNRQWGKIYGATISANPQQTIVSQVARTPGPINQSMPVYSLNSSFKTLGPFGFASNLGYQMALTFRYEF